MDLCWQSNASAFQLLSRLVIVLLPRSKHLLSSWLKPPSAVIWGRKKIKSDTVSTVSPYICHEVSKGLFSQGYGFSSGHVWVWELDCEESWLLKNWCFWTVVLEKTLESPLECKEIQPVHPKGEQSWVFIGRTDAAVETPIHWPPPAKSWLIGKYPDARRGWGQEEKGMTEDEMAGWHHQIDGCESE